MTGSSTATTTPEYVLEAWRVLRLLTDNFDLGEWMAATYIVRMYNAVSETDDWF